jgi:PAS domain-containing protein
MAEPEHFAAGAAGNAAEVRFRRLLEAAPDAMVISDRQGRIVLVNARTEGLFGYRAGELIGQKVEVLFPRAAAKRMWSIGPPSRPSRGHVPWEVEMEIPAKSLRG